MYKERRALPHKVWTEEHVTLNCAEMSSWLLRQMLFLVHVPFTGNNIEYGFGWARTRVRMEEYPPSCRCEKTWF